MGEPPLCTKLGYPSRAEAGRAAAGFAKRINKNKKMRPYRCGLCGQFHLTSKIMLKDNSVMFHKTKGFT